MKAYLKILQDEIHRDGARLLIVAEYLLNHIDLNEQQFNMVCELLAENHITHEFSNLETGQYKAMIKTESIVESEQILIPRIDAWLVKELRSNPEEELAWDLLLKSGRILKRDCIILNDNLYVRGCSHKINKLACSVEIPKVTMDDWLEAYNADVVGIDNSIVKDNQEWENYITKAFEDNIISKGAIKFGSALLCRTLPNTHYDCIHIFTKDTIANVDYAIWEKFKDYVGKNNELTNKTSLFGGVDSQV